MQTTLINANCLDVLYSLNLDYNKCVIVSDPPFNVGYHYNSYNDRLSEEDYMDLMGGGVRGITIRNHPLPRNII